MAGWEIAILVVVCVAFVAAVGIIIYNKVKGKSSCDCGGSCGSCGGCSHCRMCADVKEKTPDKTDNATETLQQ